MCIRKPDFSLSRRCYFPRKSERIRVMYRPFLIVVAVWVALAASGFSSAQSSRPRLVKPPDTLLGPEPTPPPIANKSAPLLDIKPTKPVGAAPVSSDTTHAYQLFQQKQYADATKEAKAIAAADPANAEAWKLAGFSEFYLKQYPDAADDLQKALELQRAAKEEDPNTVNALAESNVLAERFEQALPLLTTILNRPGKTPDPLFLYYRGLAEFKTGKTDDRSEEHTSEL